MPSSRLGTLRKVREDEAAAESAQHSHHHHRTSSPRDRLRFLLELEPAGVDGVASEAAGGAAEQLTCAATLLDTRERPRLVSGDSLRVCTARCTGAEAEAVVATLCIPDSSTNASAVDGEVFPQSPRAGGGEFVRYPGMLPLLAVLEEVERRSDSETNPASTRVILVWAWQGRDLLPSAWRSGPEQDFSSVENRPRVPADPQRAILAVLSVCATLRFWQDARLIHAPLSPFTISVDAEERLELFGYGRHATHRPTDTDWVWFPPEVRASGVSTAASYSWSVATLLWALLSENFSPPQKLATDGPRVMVRPDSCPPALFKLLASCWVRESEDRINLELLSLHLRAFIDAPLPDQDRALGFVAGENMGLLFAAAQNALAVPGSCTSVTVQGPSGGGKTFLAQSAGRQVCERYGFDVIRVGCSQDSDVSFHMWRSVVLQWLNFGSEPLPAEQGVVEAMLEELGLSPKESSLLARLTYGDSSHYEDEVKDSVELRNVTISSLCSLVRRCKFRGGFRPLWLIADDTQWCDFLSHITLLLLCRSSPVNSRSIVVIQCQRTTVSRTSGSGVSPTGSPPPETTHTESAFASRVSGGRSQLPPQSRELEERSATLTLSPLSISQVRDMLCFALNVERDSIPGELVQFAFAQTTGIPFFVSQLAREILRLDLLEPQGPRGVLHLRSDALVVLKHCAPAEITAFVVDRVNSTAGHTAELFFLFAVSSLGWGGETPVSQIVLRIAQNHQNMANEVEDSLAELMQTGLLVERDGDIHFVHDLVLNSAMRVQEPLELERRHAWVAEALVQLSVMDPRFRTPTALTTRAFHFSQARNTRAAIADHIICLKLAAEVGMTSICDNHARTAHRLAIESYGENLEHTSQEDRLGCARLILSAATVDFLRENYEGVLQWGQEYFRIFCGPRGLDLLPLQVLSLLLRLGCRRYFPRFLQARPKSPENDYASTMQAITGRLHFIMYSALLKAMMNVSFESPLGPGIQGAFHLFSAYDLASQGNIQPSEAADLFAGASWLSMMAPKRWQNQMRTYFLRTASEELVRGGSYHRPVQLSYLPSSKTELNIKIARYFTGMTKPQSGFAVDREDSGELDMSMRGAFFVNFDFLRVAQESGQIFNVLVPLHMIQESLVNCLEDDLFFLISRLAPQVSFENVHQTIAFFRASFCRQAAQAASDLTNHPIQLSPRQVLACILMHCIETQSIDDAALIVRATQIPEGSGHHWDSTERQKYTMKADAIFDFYAGQSVSSRTEAAQQLCSMPVEICPDYSLALPPAFYFLRVHLQPRLDVLESQLLNSFPELLCELLQTCAMLLDILARSCEAGNIAARDFFPLAKARLMSFSQDAADRHQAMALLEECITERSSGKELHIFSRTTAEAQLSLALLLESDDELARMRGEGYNEQLRMEVRKYAQNRGNMLMVGRAEKATVEKPGTNLWSGLPRLDISGARPDSRRQSLPLRMIQADF